MKVGVGKEKYFLILDINISNLTQAKVGVGFRLCWGSGKGYELVIDLILKIL